MLKFTTIALIVLLLCTPIVFADHAKFATRTGNYMTGAVAQGPSRVQQVRDLQKQIAKLQATYDATAALDKAEWERFNPDLPYYPSESLSNLADQIQALNAQLDSLWASLTTLELIQLWTTVPTPSNYNQCMKIEDLNCWDPATEAWRYAITSIEPTQPAPEPGIYDVEPGFSIPAPQPRTERQYTHLTPESGYSSTKYTLIEIRPDVYSHIADTSTMMAEPTDLTPTYYYPTQQPSTAAGTGVTSPSSTARTSIPPEEVVPYGADTVLPGNVPLTAEQLESALYQIGFYLGVIVAKEDSNANSLDNHRKGTEPPAIYEGSRLLSQFTPGYKPSAVSDTNIYESRPYSVARLNYGDGSGPLNIRQVAPSTGYTGPSTVGTTGGSPFYSANPSG